MNPIRFGFVLRVLSAPKNILNSQNLVLKNSSVLSKCYSSTTCNSSKTCNIFNRRNVTLATIGACMTGYGCYSFIKKNFAKNIEVVSPIESDLVVDIPDTRPNRCIKGSADNKKLKLTLYQYQSCPFCCKVRSYLDFKGLSYDIVEVNSFTKKEMKWSKYKKVPVLVVESESKKFQLNDSSAIISCLETFFGVGKEPIDKVMEFYPSNNTVNEKGKKILEIPNRYHIMFGDEITFDNEETQKWREWTDNVFVHTISPNIYRTPSESIKTFQYFSQIGEWDKVFSWLERTTVVYVGAAAMYFVSKLLKKRHNMSDDVRMSLYSACNTWTKHVAEKEGAKFAGGAEPDLADLAVFGVMTAMEGTEAFRDVSTNTKMNEWFQAVKQEVGNRAGKRIALDGADAEQVKVIV